MTNLKIAKRKLALAPQVFGRNLRFEFINPRDSAVQSAMHV